MEPLITLQLTTLQLTTLQLELQCFVFLVDFFDFDALMDDLLLVDVRVLLFTVGAGAGVVPTLVITAVVPFVP